MLKKILKNFLEGLGLRLATKVWWSGWQCRYRNFKRKFYHCGIVEIVQILPMTQDSRSCLWIRANFL